MFSTIEVSNSLSLALHLIHLLLTQWKNTYQINNQSFFISQKILHQYSTVLINKSFMSNQMDYFVKIANLIMSLDMDTGTLQLKTIQQSLFSVESSIIMKKSIHKSIILSMILPLMFSHKIQNTKFRIGYKKA